MTRNEIIIGGKCEFEDLREYLGNKKRDSGYALKTLKEKVKIKNEILRKK